MTDQRPTIPSPIRREIRQRCGFGCVICGCPIYDYEHIYGYDEEVGHIASEITLLCPNHHREKTNGLISLEVVEKADKNPLNIRQKISSPYGLHLAGNQATTVIGSNTLHSKLDPLNSSEFCPLVIKDEKLISFQVINGQLFLNLKVYDEDNSLLLWIQNNELQYSMVSWDVDFVGKQLTIREQPGEFVIQISFNPPHTVVIERGRFIYGGIEVNIEPDKLILPRNNTLSRNLAIAPVGIAIESQVSSGFFVMM